MDPGRRNSLELSPPALVVGVLLVLGGCISSRLVDDEIDRASRRIDDLETRIREQQGRLDDSDERLDTVVSLAEAARREANRALEMREDPFVSEPHLRVEIPFDPEEAELGEDVRAVLDQLAGRLKLENSGYFIELWAVGEGRLPDRRAREVRRHLHERGLPLHHVIIVTVDASVSATKSTMGAAVGDERSRSVGVKVVVLR